jgi:hypothetical protein
MPGDLLAACGDHHLVDMALHDDLAMGAGDRHRAIVLAKIDPLGAVEKVP